MVEGGKNPEATREKLLRSAGTIFARKGLDGARVDEIAAAAGVNKRMIYHYFGSKEELYTEVLKVHFSRVYDLGGRVVDPGAGPLANLRNITREYFYFLANNQEFVRLISWENLYGSRHAARLLPGYLRNSLPGLREIYNAGVKSGVFRSGVDVDHLILSIHGLCLVYLTRQELLHVLRGEDMGTGDRLEEWLQHMLELVQRGVLEPHNR